MRRLHVRGPDCGGVAVDADGAMLGPDAVLVHWAADRFHPLGSERARLLQTIAVQSHPDPDWLFGQCKRIAAALSEGNVALAQIYGLYIPVEKRRLAVLASLSKAGFDPDEPCIPKGEPGAGEWTFEDGSGAGEPQNGDAGRGEGSYGSDTPTEPPPAAGADEIPPRIPEEPPATAKERNNFVRRAALWLADASEAQLQLYFRMLEMAVWPIEYLPAIRSYLDAPKSLEELQDAADNSTQRGYQDHHIVERQSGSLDPASNASRFGDRLERRDNIVRIPQWKHVEISSWYSTLNTEEYGGQTPRQFLRGRSWEEQYSLGLQKPRDFGVLK